MKIFSKTSILITSLICISISFSQENNISTESQHDTLLKPHDKGIQYYLVNGVSFALKTRKTYPSTWRLLFNLSWRLDDGSSKSKRSYSSDPDREIEIESGDSDLYFSFSFQYNYFFNISKYFDPYIGLGPVLDYYRERYKDNYNEITPGNIDQERTTTVTYSGVGIIGVTGLESQVWKHLSLFLEYNIKLSYNWQSYKSESYYSFSDSRSKTEESGTRTRFEMSSVKIGVIVYF